MTETNRRVIVFGADGLRPDLVDPAVMPVLARFAAAGVRFADHHAVYPSHTRVNATTFATGTTPGRHGIVANTMLVPHATDDHIVDTSDYRHLDALQRYDRDGAQLAPSLADVLHDHGARLAVAGNGSSGSNVLWTFGHRDRLVNPGTAFGIADLYDLREKLGEPPAKTVPAVERCRYATRAVTDLFLGDPTIRVITLWLAEPDSSFHMYGLGSPESIAALRVVDECLGTVLGALDDRGLRDQVDVLVLSDHGHSTVDVHTTLREFLRQAQHDLGGHLPPLATASDFIYAEPGSPEPSIDRLRPLVEWLHAQPWVDLVLGGLEGSEAIPGVIPLAEVWNGHTNHRQPLLAVSPRWSADVNTHGVPGRVAALTTQVALQSSHGSLSPFEMHATAIAAGPSFAAGAISTTPSGGTDVMPTILHILGLPLPEGMDGRILHEALATGGDASPVETIAVTPSHPVDDGSGLILHRVGHTTYVHGTDRDTFTPAVPFAG